MKKSHNLLALGFIGLLAGQAAMVQAQSGEDAEILADGRVLSFSRNARPYFTGRVTMVPIKDTASRLGVRLEERDRGETFRMTFRGDDATYRRGRRDFELNGRLRSLPNVSEERNRILFVPLELFRDLTDRELYARRAGERHDLPQAPGGTRRNEDLDIRFRGERLRFERSEEPRYVQSVVYLPVGAMVRRSGARLEDEDRGRRMRFTYQDRVVEFTKGREDFTLNGARVWMNAPSLEISGVLFVPQILFQRLLGQDYTLGGSTWNGRPNWDDRPSQFPGRPEWDDRPSNGVGRSVEIRYDGKGLRFGGNEQPFVRGNEVFVPLRAFASRLKVRYEGRDGGRDIRLTRDGDEVRYQPPLPFYELNGRRENLRIGSVEVRDVLFVPIEVFNVFADGKVEVRRK
ncbi:MAG: stalk domain-containing protein [Fimbriimonas sp.]